MFGGQYFAELQFAGELGASQPVRPLPHVCVPFRESVLAMVSERAPLVPVRSTRSAVLAVITERTVLVPKRCSND